MKKIILLLFIAYLPLSGGINCLSNSKNLQEDFDTKEWHPVACNCDCEVRKHGRKCIFCGHLQQPRPLKVATTAKTMPTSLSPEPLRPQQALEVLVQKYISDHQ